MYPSKWNHASPERNVNCRSISPSVTDHRNQLQKWTLVAGSCGCRACMDCCCFIGSKLQQLCCPSCTRLWHSKSLELDVSVIFLVYVQVWLLCHIIFHSKHMGAHGTYVFVSCLLRFPLIQVYLWNCELFVFMELFHHEIFAETL
jgi:hypothetical protein